MSNQPTKITVEDFLKNHRNNIATWNLLDSLNPEQIDQMFEFEITLITTVEQVLGLGKLPLPKYTNSNGELCNWSQPDATPLTLENSLQVMADDPRVQEIIVKLPKQITAIIAADTKFDYQVILDGTKRMVATYYLATFRPQQLQQQLETDTTIQTLTMTSPKASIIFPYEFIRL